MGRVPEYVSRRQWRLCVALLAIGAMNWVVPRVLPLLDIPKLRLALAAITFLCGIVLIAVFTLWAYRVRQRVRVAHARICPKCGYDLRGSPYDAGTCPECGQDYSCQTLEEAWYRFRRNA